MRLLPGLLLLFLAPGVHAQWTVEGICTYQDRQFASVPPYDWTGTTANRPIRHAVVQLVAEGSEDVFASGETAADGSFRLTGPVPSGATFQVVCHAHVADGVFGAHAFHVIDAADQDYTLASEVLFAGDTAGTVLLGNLSAGPVMVPVVGAPPPNDLLQGNPFNLYDQLVDVLQYVTFLGAAAPAKDIRIRWPDSPTQVGSDAAGPIVEITHGQADADCVVLHELGHAVQFLYAGFLTSSNIHLISNPDGDPWQACTEAWATYFGATVRRFRGDANPGVYVALSASVPSSAQFFDLETGSPVAPSLIGGESSEGAIACALWDIADDASTQDLYPGDDDLVDGTYAFVGDLSGERVLWDVVTGPFSSGPLVTRTVEGIWNGMYLPTGHGQFRAVRLLLDALEIRYTEDADEPNDTLETATPLPLDTWSGIHTLYSTDNVPAVPGAPIPESGSGGGTTGTGGHGDPGNGTGGTQLATSPGDHDVFSFSAEAGQVIEVETRYPNGVTNAHTICDPYLVVRAPDASTVPGGETTSGGVGRNAKVVFTAEESGVYTIDVSADATSGRRLGSYEVRARVLP